MAGRTLATSISLTTTLALLFNAYLQGVEGVTFTIKNQCSYTVWVARIPVGGGRALGQGQTWTFGVPTRTKSARFLGRIDCSFDGSGHGTCSTGDYGGVLNCQLSGNVAECHWLEGRESE